MSAPVVGRSYMIASREPVEVAKVEPDKGGYGQMVLLILADQCCSHPIPVDHFTWTEVEPEWVAGIYQHTNEVGRIWIFEPGAPLPWSLANTHHRLGIGAFKAEHLRLIEKAKP